MRRLHTILALLLVGSTLGRPEAAPQEVRRLSLEECIKLALEHNLDIKINRYVPEMARYDIGVAYAAYEPALNVLGTHSFSQTPGGIDPQNRPFFGTKTDSDSFSAGINGYVPTGLTYTLSGSMSDRSGTSPSGQFENTSGSALINLRQPLLKNFWIDNTRLTVKVNKNRLKYSELTLRQIIMTTVRDVELAYYDLIQARENVTNQQKALELADRSLAENKKRVEVGALAQLDEKQAASEVAARRADVLTAQSALATQENVLKFLLTDDYSSWHRLALTPTEELTAIPQAFDLQLSWQRGLSLRPILLQQRLDVERQGFVLRYLHNQLFPQLDIVGSYGHSGSKREYSGAFNDLEEGNSPFYSFGGEIRLPLGNRAARNSYKSGKATEKQILLLLKKLEQQTMVEIDNAVKRAQTAFESVDATRQARLFAQDALEAEQKKLANGKSTSFIVLRLQRDLTFARTQEIRALADYNKALSELSFAEGSTLDRTGVKVEIK